MRTPNDVFTPGQLPIRPTNVYAHRGDPEKDFAKALRRGLVPLIYGEFGVGKTSMARYLARDAEEEGRLVHIESVAGKTLADVFARILEKLGYKVEKRFTESSGVTSAQETSRDLGGAFGAFSVKLQSKQGAAQSSTRSIEEELAITSPTDSRLLEIAEHAGVILLIDELHRASSEFAEQLSMFMKAYANSNSRHFKVVLLGTSADATRLVRRDEGIDRIIQEIPLRAMVPKEARYIVERGMAELHITIEPAIVDRIVRVSVGSPSIVQYLCLEVAEAAFDREDRVALKDDVEAALEQYVEKKAARLNSQCKKGIETVGYRRYRKQILRAIAEVDEFVTMEDIRSRVSQYLGEEVPSGALSGPLRQLKDAEFGALLKDIDRPLSDGRIYNYTTFSDPALKAFVRMQVQRDLETNGTAQNGG